jgi:hypothetical protein
MWHPVDNATVYTIQIDDAVTFNNPIMTVPVSDTSYAPLVDLPEGMVYWRVRCDQDPAYSPVDSVEISTSSIADWYGNLDSKGMVTVSPNPFQGVLEIAVPAGCKTQLSIFDMNGHLVQTLTGADRIVWDGTTSTGIKAQAGMYMVKAVIDGKSFTQKVILTR